jgi:hypothetical protein
MAQIELNGMQVNEVFSKIQDAGITRADAAMLVSGWIFENFGRVRRTFNYATAFPPDDADCVAQFARSFAHEDWVDGESVVQASETTGEEGFNLRFHRIESDLDALGRDAAQAFACLAEMRRDIRVLLDELRAEINRINSDLFDCCGDNDRTGVRPTVELGNFGNLVDNARFMGTTRFFEKEVSLWQTDRGTLILPAVQTVNVDILTDDRVKIPADMARFTLESRAVQNFVRQQPRGFSKEEFVKNFGNERLRSGVSVREALAILPAGASFENLEQMLDQVSDRQAAALRTTAGAQATIATTFGLEADEATVGKASVERLSALPSGVRAALLNNGITTVEQLGQADPDKLSELFRQEGVEASLGQAVEWGTLARTLTRLR